MDTQKEQAVVVKNLNKSFRLPHEQHTGIKQALISMLNGKERGYETQEVLKDISFEIPKGEFFGIVGRNGSGKSTLLKLLAGIYTPDSGLVQVNGSLTPFIELGVGFNPELTGRENVYLNGALLGFSRSEMEVMYDEIVHFAELERFMDQKLKNYSSGMQVRLAFSIAIRADSDVLIMDEVLAVGDSEFQKKCFDTFRTLKKQGRTIVLVTHDMGNVERFCDRVLILSEGTILTITSASKASEIYARLNINSNGHPAKSLDQQRDERLGSGEVIVKSISLKNSKEETKVFTANDEFNLEITLDREKNYARVPITIGIAIHNEDGLAIFGPNSEEFAITSNAKQVVMTISNLRLKPGEYSVTIIVFEKETKNQLDVLNKWVSFSVVSDHQIGGILEVDSDWRFLDD